MRTYIQARTHVIVIVIVRSYLGTSCFLGGDNACHIPDSKSRPTEHGWREC